jgi:flagellar hook-associated protein 2
MVVTQSSAAATKRSDAALTTQTFGGGLLGFDPEFVDVEIDGVATSIRFEAQSYTAQEIADTINQGLSDAGLDATASLGTDGRLVVTTGGEGSANTIQFTGGPLAKLQMTADATAIAGTDAIVSIAGTISNVTDLRAGDTVTVSTPDGDLELDLTGGLRLGRLDVTTVDVGTGTLAEVASAINGSTAGASAAAIRVGDGAWRLQLNARTSGADGKLMLDDSVFAGIGGLVESSAARNAELVIGEGAGSYTVESSTNTFSDVLGGTSLTVASVTTSPVTVNVSRNTAGLATDVAALVSAANTALAEIKVQTRYGVDGAGNGALAGNGTVRRMADQLRASLSRPVDGFTDLIGADVGIEIKRDGSFSFDQAKFTAAMAEDPAAVARFFGRSATTPAGVTFADATPETVTGSYAIEVTTAATQATSARIFDGGSASATRVGIRFGDTTLNVDIGAGRTSAQIIDAINAELTDAGAELVAAADAGGLVVRSTRWGTAGDFELNLDVNGAGTWDDVTGTNIAGTIAGVTATGIGRTLSLNILADSNAAGLSVVVDGGVSGALGNIDYQPGVGARVAELTTQLTGIDGVFDGADQAQQRRVDDFNGQIERFEDRLFTREANLRRQWASLQTLLQGLQEQGTFLAGQLSGLPNYSQS